MKNTGKQLERVVRLVEESYKDSANTQIFSNYKLPNKDGEEREIDLLIVSKINGFEICIAIECKDYNTRVSVDKIDSFQGKCSRLPQIHRNRVSIYKPHRPCFSTIVLPLEQVDLLFLGLPEF